MFKLKCADGTIREVEGIDLNVYNNEVFGDGKVPVRLTASLMYRNADGLWETETGVTLFTAETNLPVEEYYDEWYGLSEDTTPGDIPGPVLDIVNNILKEISL